LFDGPYPDDALRDKCCRVIYEFNNYRSYLRAVLADRTARNPSYSLRALAQQLGFASSSLSEVMNGKANFSKSSAWKTARGLGLGSQESEYLSLLVELDSARDPDARELILGRLRELSPQSVATHDLGIDQFRQIAEWYHSAILELVTLEEFDLSPANVASRLGITQTDARAAIERLERLELIERSSSGRYVRTKDRLMVRSAPANTGLRTFYRQMLAKADQALDSQASEERASGYETFALAPAAMPEVREALDRFLNELQTISRKHPGRETVHHALVHVFNLTPSKEGKK
jgi:uncharacterized protein (TIGR02147 family)